jgi:hypothetical protein
MVHHGAVVAAVALATGLAGAAQAQTATKGLVERYLSWYSGKVGQFEIKLDAVVEEKLAGKKVVAATIDACVPAAPNSLKLDHFTANLTVKGDTLVATSATSDKVPTAISIQRSVADDQVAVTAKIRRGNLQFDTQDTLSYADANPLTDTANSDVPDTSGGTEPVDSSNAFSVVVQPAHALDVFRALRTVPVKIDGGEAYPTCDNLRFDKQTLDFTIDPQRVRALTAQLKAIPGVIDVHRGNGDLTKVDAVRFKADAKLDADTIVKKTADVVAATLGGSIASLVKDDYTGEQVITLKRTFDLATDPNFVQTFEIGILVERDASNNVTLYVGYPKAKIALAGDDTHLQFSEVDSAPQGEEPTVGTPSPAPIVAELARVFQATTWDNENNTWK